MFRVFRVFPVALLLMTAACGAPPKSAELPAPPKSETAYDTQAQLQESLTEAIEAAETILKNSPDDPDALLAAALAAEHLGRTDLAIRYYARLQKSTQETEHLQKLAELTRESDPAAAFDYAVRFFQQGGADDRQRFWLIRQHMEKKDPVAAFALTEGLNAPPDKFAAEFLRDVCLQYAKILPASSPLALSAVRRAALFAALPNNFVETAALTCLNSGDAQAAQDILKNYSGPAYLLRAKIAEKLQMPAVALSYRLKYFHSGGSDPRELLILMDELGRSTPAIQVAEALWKSGSLDASTRLTVARALAGFYRESPRPDTAAEIKFLEELKSIGDPVFLDRLADLQRSVGNAREALVALRSRYPNAIPADKVDLYVGQALSAGEIPEALRVAESSPPAAFSLPVRRRLAEILNAYAEEDLAAGRVPAARVNASRAVRFLEGFQNHKIMAKSFLQAADTPAAFAHLSAALKFSPADPEANDMAGRILFSQGRWADAKAYVQAAHAGRYPDEELPLMLGRILFSQNLPAEAFSAFHEYAVAKNNQVPPDVQELMGLSARAAGRPAEAAIWFERRLAFAASEDIAAAWLDALISSGQKPRALGAARQLALKYPASRPILEAASNVFEVSTDSPALLRCLESLSSLTPEPDKKAGILRRLLGVKIGMGQTAAADAILSTLLDRFPNDPQLLTEAWKIRKGTPAVEPILKRLATIRSPSDPIQLIHARELLDDKRVDEALRVVQAFGGVKKNDPDALALEAEIWILKKNPASAASAYRALLNVRKDEPARKWLVGHVYDLALAAVAAGKAFDDAPMLYSEAAKLLGSEEKFQDLYELFGKIFDRRGDRALAIDAYGREFKLATDPKKRIQLSETLGQLYFQDAQLSLAREMFQASDQAGNRSAAFLRSFAKLRERLGEEENAAKLYEAILKEFPYDRDANLFMARRATNRGQLAEALKFLESLRAASPSDSAVLNAMGSAYAALGKHDAAADVWEKLVDQTGSPKFISRYADALYQSGQLEKALREYRAILTFDVASLEQLRRLADLEKTQGNWNQAEKILLKLLNEGGTAKDRESFAEVLRKIGASAVQQGNALEAARAAERLMDLRENDPTSFLLMGRAKLLEGKFELAAESFSRAKSLAPADPRPLVGLAEVELRNQRPLAAIDYARKAIALDPSHSEAYTLIGLAYQRQGDIQNAYAALKEAIQYSKNRAAAHVRMGDLFLQHAKFNVALQQYRQAVELDPKNARAHERYAVALHHLGFTENAMKELLKAMEIDPAGIGAEATALLADIFVAHDESAKARELLESAAARPSAPAGVLIRLGEMYRQNGEAAKSLRFFRDAIAATDDPSLKYDALNALGMALTDMDEKTTAEKAFREAVSLMPGRPEAFLNLSLLFRAKNDFLAAVDSARKAIESAPEKAEGYKLLGLIYYEAGWEKESLAAFRESLKRNPDQAEISGLVRQIEEPAESDQP